MSMQSQRFSPVKVGFFSYSREDDEDSGRRLSELRALIQREFRSQIGLAKDQVHIFQDRESIAYGKNWENEIQAAIRQAVFFIPIITPRAVRSQHCKTEFEAFLQREGELGRQDLIFPIHYIRVPALERDEIWRSDPVLRIVGVRQYDDWQSLRHLDVDTSQIRDRVATFCSRIVEALGNLEADLDQWRERAETKRRLEEAERENSRLVEAERQARETEQRLQAEVKRKAEAESEAQRRAQDLRQQKARAEDGARQALQRRLAVEAKNAADARMRAAEARRREHIEWQLVSQTVRRLHFRSAEKRYFDAKLTFGRYGRFVVHDITASEWNANMTASPLMKGDELVSLGLNFIRSVESFDQVLLGKVVEFGGAILLGDLHDSRKASPAIISNYLCIQRKNSFVNLMYGLQNYA